MLTSDDVYDFGQMLKSVYRTRAKTAARVSTVLPSTHANVLMVFWASIANSVCFLFTTCVLQVDIELVLAYRIISSVSAVNSLENILRHMCL